eukprot:s3355_g1.t1
MGSFEPSSIYGSRVGWQELLLVTASDTKNVFHKSILWKQGHVSNIAMLPRSDMLKPPRTEGKYGSDGRFTRVQEMKQVMSLNAVLKSLEDAAEVGVQLAEHQLTKDSAGNLGVKPLENVCFTLDALKPRKRAKV